jgi:hypothetical protein
LIKIDIVAEKRRVLLLEYSCNSNVEKEIGLKLDQDPVVRESTRRVKRTG